MGDLPVFHYKTYAKACQFEITVYPKRLLFIMNIFLNRGKTSVRTYRKKVRDGKWIFDLRVCVGTVSANPIRKESRAEMRKIMKKTIWITGVFVVLGILAVILYFSLFREKSSVMPEGTFVKGPEAGCFFAGAPESEVTAWRRSA